MKKFKLGLDIHGVIDSDPDFFSTLTKILKGHPEVEVHIITGGHFHKEKENLENWGIEYDEFFSIYDYHYSKGTPTWYDTKGDERMDELEWDKTKGEYCAREGITIMIDDTYKYSKYMPETTHFYHYLRDNK
jgi:hypothetical protein